MKRFLRISEAAAMLGVCAKTIRRWHAAGKIECKFTPGGPRRISLFEITRILEGGEKHEDPARGVAVYSRVSSHEQKKKGDLDRQVEAARAFCRERGVVPAFTFTDVASGLNARRRGRAGETLHAHREGRGVEGHPDLS